MKPFWVYMLLCRDGSYYIGHTDNLEKRIPEHNEGVIKSYTFSRLPVKLVWSQTFMTRQEALDSERQIKGWSRAKKKALIHGDWEEIKKLAKGRKQKDDPSTGSGRTG